MTTESVDLPPATDPPLSNPSSPKTSKPVRAPKAPKEKAAPKSPKTKAPKIAKAKTPSNHPPYSSMIKKAVSELKDKKGSSKAAILKYIVQHFKVGENIKSVNAHLRQALKRGVTSGALSQVKGAGASGSFRLGVKAPSSPKPKKAKSAPKKAPGSPARAKATKPKKVKASPKKAAPAKAKASKAAKASPKKRPASKKTQKQKAIATPKAKGGQARVEQVAKIAAVGAKPENKAKAAAIAERRAAQKHNVKPKKGIVRKAAAEATSS